MSRGRKRDKTYTGTHGGDGGSVDVSKLKAMERGPVSVQDRKVGSSQAEMQRAVKNGECPFCGRRFKNIAVHTNRTHGIDSFQLKDMLGVPKSHSVCTPELSNKLAERSRQWLADNPDVKQRLRTRGNRRSYSKAGRAVQRAKALSITPETAKRVGRLNTEMRRAAAADRDRAIIDRIRAGASRSDVCAKLGVSPSVVKSALKFHGEDIDLRSRRRITSTSEQLDEARRVLLAQLDEQASERMARWAGSEKDYAAVHACATEWGTTTKQAAAWLRKRGENVPDGRARPPLDPSKCGTLRNYRKHRQNGEKPCRSCQDANNRHHAAYMRRRNSIA